MRSRTGRPHGLRLLVTVTFNANQLRAHLLPLIALDEVESITLVSDRPAPDLPKLRVVVPSTRTRRVFGRAGAKLAICQRLARAERFDWVMGFHFSPHGFNAIRVADRVGTRSMYHMIGGEPEWRGGGYASSNGLFGRLPRPSPHIERAMLRHMSKASVVATMGPRVREVVIKAGLDPSKVAVIPPATDVERFTPSVGGHRSYDVVCVASLVKVKQLGDLVDAVALLRRDFPDYRLALAGDGPLRTLLEQRAVERQVDGMIDFLGHVEQTEDLYRDAHAFVMTSASEGMPIGMLDAMASGLPVVVSDVGEISTLVADERNGLLFRSGDVEGLASRLATLGRDSARRDAMGRAARADVLARHSVDSVGRIYARVFAEASASTREERATPAREIAIR